MMVGGAALIASNIAYFGTEAASRTKGADVTILIPIFNEEANLECLVAELLSTLVSQNFSWTVLFVDDGSTDKSLAKLKNICAVDNRFKAISLSRNFGKDRAIAAGLRYAQADAVVIMDADLQHPPSLIPKLVERWRAGFKVVFAQRQNRDCESLSRKLFSQAFYAIFRSITQTQLPNGVGDFVLLDRAAVEAINGLGERTRFSKGLYSWIGFRSAGITFRVEQRRAGTSRWSAFKLIRFALDGLVSFSNLPLKVWSVVGAFVSFAALAYSGYFIVRTILFDADVPGFPSLIVSIMFFSGVQLISLGVIGEYLARVYEEVKGRPLYIVAEEVGIHAAEETSVGERRLPNVQQVAVG
jgi:glycosyltransferase involved in cell wall biosynthesis